MSIETVGLLAIFKAAPGQAQSLFSELKTIVAVAAQEPRTLVYGLHEVVGDPDTLIVYEIYANPEAQRLHGLSDAIAQLRTRMPELLAAPPELKRLTPIAGAVGLPF